MFGISSLVSRRGDAGRNAMLAHQGKNSETSSRPTKGRSNAARAASEMAVVSIRIAQPDEDTPPRSAEKTVGANSSSPAEPKCPAFFSNASEPHLQMIAAMKMAAAADASVEPPARHESENSTLPAARPCETKQGSATDQAKRRQALAATLRPRENPDAPLVAMPLTAMREVCPETGPRLHAAPKCAPDAAGSATSPQPSASAAIEPARRAGRVARHQLARRLALVTGIACANIRRPLRPAPACAAKSRRKTERKIVIRVAR